MTPEEQQYFKITLDLTEKMLKICDKYSFNNSNILIHYIEDDDFTHIKNFITFKDNIIKTVSSIHIQIEDYINNELDQRCLTTLQNTINDLILNL